MISHELLRFAGTHFPALASLDVVAMAPTGKWLRERYRHARGATAERLLPAKCFLDERLRPGWAARYSLSLAVLMFLLNLGLATYRTYYVEDLLVPAIEWHAQSEAAHLPLYRKAQTAPQATHRSAQYALWNNENTTWMTARWIGEDKHHLAVVNWLIILTGGLFSSFVKLLRFLL